MYVCVCVLEILHEYYIGSSEFELDKSLYVKHQVKQNFLNDLKLPSCWHCQR